MARYVIAGTQQVEVPPDVPLDWPGIKDMTITLDDGSEQGFILDVLSGEQGVYLVNRGVRGLFMPPITRHTASAAGVPGTTFTGFDVGERETFWPLLTYSDKGSADFVALDQRLWLGLEPDKLATWRVTGPGGDTRTLSVRFKDDGDPALDSDPTQDGLMLYGVLGVAESPFWRGPKLTRRWAAPDHHPFFNPAGLWINSSQSLQNATMANPGRLPTSVVWTAYGPSTSVTVGVDGYVDEIPFPIAAGQAVLLDGRPTVKSAYLHDVQIGADGEPLLVGDGQDVTGMLGQTSFHALPPGAAVSLDIVMNGAGVVQADIEPAYYRAW